MDYVNFSDKILFDDASKISSFLAYAENGVAHISFTILSGASGILAARIKDEKYIPRATVNGAYAAAGIVEDINKIPSVAIYTDGRLVVWVAHALVHQEDVTFVYPIRRG